VALAEAQKNHWYRAIAVVDPSGTLVYYEKMENTQTGSASLRILGLPGAVSLEGGVPLVVNDQIVGAIGVSGDCSDHDGMCAQAAAGSLKWLAGSMAERQVLALPRSSGAVGVRRG
jgi:glc operon protein GlcG